MFGHSDWTVLHILRCEVCHFGLSAVVGWLAYWLTSTILSRTGLREKLPERTTFLLLLLAALSCALLAHVLEDYTVNWF